MIGVTQPACMDSNRHTTGHECVVCATQTAHKSGKKSLAAAAVTNRLRAVTAPEGVPGLTLSHVALHVEASLLVCHADEAAGCHQKCGQARLGSTSSELCWSAVPQYIRTFVPTTSGPDGDVGTAGAADDQTLDLQQALTAATAADTRVGEGGSTISPSLLTLDAGAAFEKGVCLRNGSCKAASTSHCPPMSHACANHHAAPRSEDIGVAAKQAMDANTSANIRARLLFLLSAPIRRAGERAVAGRHGGGAAAVGTELDRVQGGNLP